jgi:hypothetical protein
MMKYMLIYLESAEELRKREDPSQAEAYWGGWTAYMGAMAQSGVLMSGNGLQPPGVATTLRVVDGKRHVLDGPFADTKEMLGGYAIVEAADLDDALEWAARAPCASAGSVEVRPVLPAPPAN